MIQFRMKIWQMNEKEETLAAQNSMEGRNCLCSVHSPAAPEYSFPQCDTWNVQWNKGNKNKDVGCVHLWASSHTLSFPWTPTRPTGLSPSPRSHGCQLITTQSMLSYPTSLNTGSDLSFSFFFFFWSPFVSLRAVWGAVAKVGHPIKVVVGHPDHHKG